MGIGAQVRITTPNGQAQWNEVTTAVGYASSSDSRVHFGLESNRVIKKLEVRSPSGMRQVLHDIVLHDIEVDRVLNIKEPAN